MENIEYAFLDKILYKYFPIFANEVFVIFTNHTYIPQLDSNSIHLEFFWEKIKLMKSIYSELQSRLEKDPANNYIYFISK